ncbi:MAG: hypothetical protein KGJ19_08695, partial [Betaproteobacteria bacterium]|nr:hypothetical protein [Betaproteobacteria bacterium]
PPEANPRHLAYARHGRSCGTAYAYQQYDSNVGTETPCYLGSLEFAFAQRPAHLAEPPRKTAQTPLLAVAATLNDSLPEILELMRPLARRADWCDTYDTWKRALNDSVPSLWHLRAGGILRSYGTNVLVDITTATNALLQRVELSRSPLLGNEKAGAFESECQDLINSSSWAPDDELAAYRGRTLRRGATALTAIDAIGACMGRLLLVSCKSLIYDGDYDKGTYRVIRNAQSTVDRAVQEWDAVVADIRANPVGDNFDFSRFRVVIGVVCTPYVVYLSNESRNQRLDGRNLHACIAAIELKECKRSLNSVWHWGVL